MKPWFYNEQSITEFKEPVVYKGLNISVSKTKVKPPYIATVTSPATGKEVVKMGGNTEQEALDSAKQAVDKREADAPKISAGGQTSVLLNTPSNDELLKDPSMYNMIYAKISKDRNGPTLVIGNEVYGRADLEADGFVGSYDRRTKRGKDSEETLPQVMFNANNKLLSQIGIKMNGRYTLDTSGKYRDDNEHTVYPLQFQGSTVHAGDRLRMSRPALTIGATREDAQPWFQREIEEADIIKFPEPKAKVVELPNVQMYPDFITGVKDLHNRKDKGEISQDSHDKLYADLINRFMKKESFENPWFLREYKSLDQAKKEIIQSVQNLDLSDKENAEKNANLLDQVYSILKSTDTMGRLGGTLKNALSDEYKENELVAISELVNNAKIQYKEKIGFLKNLQEDKCIAVDMLKTPGNYPIGDLFFNDPKNVAVFNALLPYGAGAKQKGKGEHALGIMSKRITVRGSGDINVDGVATELKVETSTGGGRLGEPGAVPNSEQMKSIFNKYKKLVPMLFDQQGNFQKPRLNVSVFTSMANQAKLNPREKKQLATDVFGAFWGTHAKPIIAEFSKANADPDTVRRLHVRANFDWYKDWMANTKGEAWVNIAILSIANKQLAVISSGNDITNGTVKIQSQNPYIVTPQPREAFTQINLK